MCLNPSKALGGNKYDAGDDIKEAVHNWLIMQPIR